MAHPLSYHKNNTDIDGRTSNQSSVFTTDNQKGSEKLDFWKEVVCDRVAPLDFTVEANGTFEGALRWTKIDDIQLSDIRATPHVALRTLSSIRKSDSDAFVFNLLQTGRCDASQDGRSARMNNGMGWFCSADRPYELNFDQPFHLTSVQIPRHMINRNISGADRLVAYNLSHSSQLYPLVQNYILQLAQQRPQFDKITAEKVALNLAELVSTLIGEHLSNHEAPLSNSKVASLLRIRAFVEANLHDPDLCPTRVAEAMRMSTRYINQLLEAENTSLSRYIWQRRVERVATLLKNPVNAGNSLSSFAYACGFNDMTHFSKAFRKHFGMSPSEYRSLCNE